MESSLFHRSLVTPKSCQCQGPERPVSTRDALKLRRVVVSLKTARGAAPASVGVMTPVAIKIGSSPHPMKHTPSPRIHAATAEKPDDGLSADSGPLPRGSSCGQWERSIMQ
jgi:hypothetical protein